MRERQMETFLAGWTGFTTSLTSTDPPDERASLSDVLETGPHLLKYCLSPKAAAGILRRAERRDRVLPESLMTALRAVAER
jgi:hypothetical protein